VLLPYQLIKNVNSLMKQCFNRSRTWKFCTAEVVETERPHKGLSTEQNIMSQRPRPTGRKYWVAVKRGLKLRQNIEAERGALDKHFNRTTSENEEKALKKPHHR